MLGLQTPKWKNRTDFQILHPCPQANDILAPIRSEIIVTVPSLFQEKKNACKLSKELKVLDWTILELKQQECPHNSAAETIKTT